VQAYRAARYAVRESDHADQDRDRSHWWWLVPAPPLRQTLTVPGTAASHAPKLYKRTGGATKDLVLQSGNQVPVGIQAVVPSSVGQLAAGATGADQSSSTFIEFFLPEGKLYWQPNPNTADTTAVVSIILGKLEG